MLVIAGVYKSYFNINQLVTTLIREIYTVIPNLFQSRTNILAGNRNLALNIFNLSNNRQSCFIARLLIHLT